jgi:hypothetical protein
MDPQWMIFAHESTGAHYWYSSNFGARPLTDHNDPFTDQDLDEMEGALNTPRQQRVIIQKARYRVVTRGKFYEV